MVASWDLGPTNIDFTDSEFIPDQGVLLLYSHSGNDTTKWTISFRKGSTGAAEGVVHGFSNGNTGLDYDLVLKRP